MVVPGRGEIESESACRCRIASLFRQHHGITGEESKDRNGYPEFLALPRLPHTPMKGGDHRTQQLVVQTTVHG